MQQAFWRTVFYMKKLKLVNQLRKLKQKEVHVYDLGGEFHKLGSGPLLSWQPLLFHRALLLFSLLLSVNTLAACVW